MPSHRRGPKTAARGTSRMSVTAKEVRMPPPAKSASSRRLGNCERDIVRKAMKVVENPSHNERHVASSPALIRSRESPACTDAAFRR
jgi:hypothetical protein